MSSRKQGGESRMQTFEKGSNVNDPFTIDYSLLTIPIDYYTIHRIYKNFSIISSRSASSSYFLY